MSGISIVIPSFNRAKVIGNTLDSLLWQTFANWECIIVDDGSTDETLKIIKEYCKIDSRFRLFKRDREPKGATTCRNIGWQNSKFNSILFLDSDDILMPWCLKERMEFVLKHPEIDLCLFQGYNIFNNKAPELRGNPTLKDYILGFLSFQMTFQTSSPVWKKEMLEKIEGWKEGLISWQDPDIHCRALSAKAFVKWGSVIPDFLIRTEKNDNFKITNFNKSILNYDKVLKSYTNTLAFLKDQKYIDVFKKNIAFQAWQFGPFLKWVQVDIVAKELYNLAIFNCELKKTYIKKIKAFLLLKNIPILRKWAYSEIKENESTVKNYQLYVDEEVNFQFEKKFKNYFGDTIKFPLKSSMLIQLFKIKFDSN